MCPAVAMKMTLNAGLSLAMRALTAWPSLSMLLAQPLFGPFGLRLLISLPFALNKRQLRAVTSLQCRSFGMKQPPMTAQQCRKSPDPNDKLEFNLSHI
mmetsp:Transcript_14101/g.31194  ORF Transcript_14101/g.31194 Transcript_14101/m.31194 type:complete len:98 (+) Transcript_14101:101-394(+)